MSGAALALALAALAAPQEEQSIEEEIAALVAKTNALETLRLVYDTEGRTARGTLEVVYRAPDFGRVRLSLPDHEMDSWVDGRMAYLCIDGEWRRVECPASSAARSVLDERFPCGGQARRARDRARALRRKR